MFKKIDHVEIITDDIEPQASTSIPMCSASRKR